MDFMPLEWVLALVFFQLWCLAWQDYVEILDDSMKDNEKKN